MQERRRRIKFLFLFCFFFFLFVNICDIRAIRGRRVMVPEFRHSGFTAALPFAAPLLAFTDSRKR